MPDLRAFFRLTLSGFFSDAVAGFVARHEPTLAALFALAVLVAFFA